MRAVEPREPFRVGLLLTERCNVECEHCWFSCGPDRTAEMTEGEARGYIDQITEVPSIEWVSFTGGEPFLMPETLRNLVGYASEKGLKTECVTNCFWTGSEEMAENILRELVDAGLDVINLSADDFHQRHIPFSRIRNCYEAAKSIDLRMVIMCAVSKSSELTVDRIARLLGEDDIRIIGGEKIEAPAALAVETGFLPVGRGEAIPESEWVVGREPVDGPCGAVLRDVAIAPGGDLLPCCSAAGVLDNVRLGNVGKESLGALISKAWSRDVFRVLSREGPVGLLRRADLEERVDYVNRCHACVDALERLGTPSTPC